MKRPAFQFYPGDWRKDVELRSCTVAARGLWIDLMCVMHECEPYGHLVLNGKPMTPAQLAGQVGNITAAQCAKLIDELLDNGVARKTEGGLIYSKRMVDDERVRNARAEGGKAGSEHGAKGAEHGIKGGRPKTDRGDKEPPSKPPLEPPPSSSSSSSTSVENKDNPVGLSVNGDAVDPERPVLTLVSPQPPAALPDCPHQDLIGLYRKHLPALRQPMRWDGERAEAMRVRWRECSQPTAFGDGYRTKDEGLAFWDRFFAYVARTPKLRDGITSREGGQSRVWKPSLDWLVTRGNFTKVIEGAYE